MLHKRQDEHGNIIYSFSNVRKGVPVKMHEVRQLHARDIWIRRMDYEKIARVNWFDLDPVNRKINQINRLSKNRFVSEIAKRGDLYGKFAREVIEDACQGFSPDAYNLHHIVPIALGGKDVLSNMVLIHKNAHKPFMHERVFNLLHKKIKPRSLREDIPQGEKTFVEIPVFPHVLTEQAMRLIFTDYADYEDERDRAMEANQTDETSELKPMTKNLAEQVKLLRERGELPPEPTKGAPTRILKRVQKNRAVIKGRQKHR